MLSRVGPRDQGDGLHIVSSHPWDAAAYLLVGPEPVLIDCGSALGYEQTVANIRATGVDPAEIEWILATHCHWDHVSAAAAFHAEFGTRLAVHGSERWAVEVGDYDFTAAFLYEQPFPPARVERELRDGERLRFGPHAVEVHHTPSHTPGSCSFVVQRDGGRRLLLAGDTLWGGYHEKIGSDLLAWRASLAKLDRVAFDAIHFGHGAPDVIPDGRRVLQKAIRSLDVYWSPWFVPYTEDAA